MNKFPKALYVREEKDGDDIYYIASTTPEEALDGDGPQLVAVYTLNKVENFRKVVEAVR